MKAERRWYKITDVMKMTGMGRKWIMSNIGPNLNASPPQIPLVKLGMSRTAPFVIDKKDFEEWNERFLDHFRGRD